MSRTLTLFSKAIVMVACCFGMARSAQAQVSVTATAGTVGPTGYITLGGAFAAINAGTHQGVITVNITANTTEASTASLNASGAGSASYTSVLVRPNGGAARTIQGAIIAGSALIDLNGADNVTFDGLNSGGDALTIENTTVAATSGTSTVRFLGDATNNTITRCTINGAATMATTTNGGTIYFAAGAVTTGNDGNTISFNNIGPSGSNFPTKAIYGNGSTTTTTLNNSGITITGNNIYDYFGAAVNNAGMYIAGGCTAWTITNNKLYQTTTKTFTTGATHCGIQIVNTTSADGYTITGNTIGFASSSRTGTYTIAGALSNNFYGILLSGLSSSTTNTITTNAIRDISFTTTGAGTTGGSYPFAGINISTTAGTISVSNDTIRNISFPGTGTGNFAAIDINSSGTGTHTVNGNVVDNMSRTASGNIIVMRFSSPTTITLNNNTINNIAVNNTAFTGTIYGIHTISSALNTTASGNTITNLTTTGTGTATLRGIYEFGSSGNKAFQNNIINNITAGGGATIDGIRASATSTPNPMDLSGNTINTLSGGIAVSGITHASSSATINIYKNKIYDLSTTNTNPTVAGITLSSGTTANIYNNLVGDLRATAANAANAVIGLNITGGTTVNLYYNTVRLAATSSGTVFGSSALSASTSPTLALNNNILINNSTANTTGLSVAYRRSSTTLTSYAAASNYNLLFAGVLGGSASQLIFYDGTNSDQTLAAFKTRVSTRDAASVTENCSFASTTGSSSTFLHFAAATSTLAESGGANVGSITVDYDNQTRQGNGGYAGTGTAPDIGADEFEGTNPSAVALDMGATALVSPATTGCYTSTQTVTVTVKNYGTATIDFSVNPTTVTTQLSGASTSTLSATLNSGTLAAGATQNVNMSTTLNMSAAGTYTFNASTAVTGDGNSSNDAMSAVNRTVVAPVSLPQSCDFTGYTGANLTTFFPNWSEAAGATVPSGTTSVWISTTLSGTTTAKINLFTNTRQEWIVGPKFTAASGSQLKFKIAITDFASTAADPSGMQGTDDRVVVKISTDCGASYSDLFTYNAANTSAITNSLVQQTISLNSYAGQQCIIAFAAYDGPTDDSPDYDFHLDDILIETPPALDMSATSLIAPVATGCYSAAETVTIRVTNNGTATIDFATNPTTVTTQLSGASTATLSATLNSGTLAAGATQDVNMSTTLDMSASGTYTFNASTSVSGDGNTGNDALTAANRTVIAPVATPYSQDFSAGTFPSNWTNTSSWSIATTHGNTNYGIYKNIYSSVTTAQYDVVKLGPLGASESISFDYRLVNFTSYPSTALPNSPAWGNITIQISTNCGGSFSTFQTIDNTNHVSTTAWATKSYSLAAYSGQQVILRFIANWTAGDWYADFDNFNVIAQCTGSPSGGTSSPATATLCAGLTQAMTNNAVNSGSGITYQWMVSSTSGSGYANVSGGTGATTQSYTTGALAAGTWYYVCAVTCSGSSQTTNSSEVVVTVNAAPTVSASSNSPVCTGATLNLNGTTSAGTTFSWTGPNSFTDANEDPSITGVTTAAAGTYTFTATAAGCTSAPTTTTVVVNTTPTVPVMTPTSATICAGSSVGLSASSTANESANSPTGGAITVSTVGANNGVPFPSTVTVSGLPTSGVTVTSVSINGYSHTWPNDVDLLLQSPTAVNVILMADVGTSGGNDVVNVNYVFQDGQPAMSNASTQPSGTYAPTSGDAVADVFTPGPGSVNQASPALSNFTGDPNGVWNLYMADDANLDGGSITSWSITFQYNSATYSWSPSIGLSPTTGASVTANPTGTQTYTVTAANGLNNTCTASNTVTVTVNPLPTPACGSYGPYCSNDAAVTLGGSPSGGTWTGTGVTGTGPYSFNPSAGTQTLQYSYTDGNGCTGTCNTTITVNTAPVVTCGGPYGPYCTNSGVVTLNGLPAGGAWSGTAVEGNTFFPSISGAGDFELTYTYTDANGCTGSCTTTITVYAATPVTCDGPYGPFCSGDAAVTLGGSPTGGSWSGAGVTGNQFDPGSADSGPNVLVYTFTNANGCITSCQVTINVDATDTDGDQTPDCTDGCPLDPNKTSPGTCGCGVPDADNDGDGTLNCLDLCPNDPNKIAPGNCGCGAPEAGATCDDGNSTTFNDVVQPNCTCQGQPMDCLGVIGGSNMPGTPCNDGNANTANDTWDASCVCVGTPVSCQNNMKLVLQTDNNGSQTSWEIVPQPSGAAVCSGSGYASNTSVTLDCCLPNGCYDLKVYDSFGDGMCCSNGMGGFVLRYDFGDRIIDNTADGQFSSLSQAPLGFCLPISEDKINAYTEDLTNVPPSTGFLQAVINPAVSAQYGITNSTSGYQFWFLNPDGGYSRRLLITHAYNNYWFTAGPTRASFVKLSSINTNPLPMSTLLNVRVRTLVAGTYGAFGAACRLTLACPITQLVNDVLSSQHSCGKTGLLLNGTQYIYAVPVAGAVKYQFEFTRIGYMRKIASTGNQLLLSSTWLNPLQPGLTYNVRVRVTFDTSTSPTWLCYGPYCTIGTAAPPPFTGGGQHAMQQADAGELLLWPNPNRDGVLHLELAELPEAVSEVTITLFDQTGREAMRRIEAVEGGLNIALPLDAGLANGVYSVRVQAGDTTFMKRLVVE